MQPVLFVMRRHTVIYLLVKDFCCISKASFATHLLFIQINKTIFRGSLQVYTILFLAAFNIESKKKIKLIERRVYILYIFYSKYNIVDRQMETLGSGAQVG